MFCTPGTLIRVLLRTFGTLRYFWVLLVWVEPLLFARPSHHRIWCVVWCPYTDIQVNSIGDIGQGHLLKFAYLITVHVEYHRHLVVDPYFLYHAESCSRKVKSGTGLKCSLLLRLYGWMSLFYWCKSQNY